MNTRKLLVVGLSIIITVLLYFIEKSAEGIDAAMAAGLGVGLHVFSLVGLYQKQYKPLNHFCIGSLVGWWIGFAVFLTTPESEEIWRGQRPMCALSWLIFGSIWLAIYAIHLIWTRLKT